MSERRDPYDDRNDAMTAEGTSAQSRPVTPGAWVKVGVPLSVAFLFALVFFIGNPFKLSLFTGEDANETRNAIAVLHFDNLADPSDRDRTAQMTTSLMVVGLSESPHVRVISRAHIDDLLHKLGHSSTQEISRILATEVGRRAGARWVVTGSVLRTEPQVVLVSNISSVKDGTVIASERADGADGDDLFAVVDRLCAAVCQDLSLPGNLDPQPGNERLARLTTSSPDAYRAYMEGVDFQTERDNELALKSFERAVRLDTAFAMAYYKLARAQHALGRLDEAKRSLERATRYADKASLMNRLYIQSFRAQVDGDYNQVAAYLEELTEQFPQQKQALFDLGTIYFRQFKLDEAIATLEQSLALDSNCKPVLNSLARAYQWAGDYDKSVAVMSRYVDMASNEPDLYDTRGEIEAMNGHMDAAIASYNEALKRKPDFHHAIANLGHLCLFKGDYRRADSLYRIFINSASHELRAAGRLYFAYIPLYRGKFDEALAVLDKGVVSDVAEQVAAQDLAVKHEMKARIYAFLEDYDHALAETAIETELRCSISPQSCGVARANFIQLLVDSGRLTEARDSLRSFEQQINDGNVSETKELSYARGILARAHGDYDLAIENFRAAARTHDFRPRYELARTCLADNRLGEAVMLFRGLAGTWCEYRANNILAALESEYLLGVAYEKSGRTIEAEKQFERYVSMCGADSRHTIQFTDALNRLSRLASSN